MLFQYTINYIFCFLRQSRFTTADHLPTNYLLDGFTYKSSFLAFRTWINSKGVCCPSYLDIIFQTSKFHFLNFYNFPRSEDLHYSMWRSAPKTNISESLILGILSSSIVLHYTCHYSYVISEPVLIYLCSSQVLLLHFSPQILILRTSHIFLLCPLYWDTILSSGLH